MVQALAFCTPIVTLGYWRAVLRSVESNGELPDAENFTPSINEGTINKESVSLKINARRKVIFKNVAFVCFSQAQYALKDIVKCAGGKVALYKEGKFSVNQLCSKKVVVLQMSNDSSEPSQASVASYESVQKALQESKRRLVPESEIFLAILYSSVEKYCNPSFDFKRLIGTSGRNKTKDLLSTTILAPDTEAILPTQRAPGKIIPETLTMSEKIVEQDTNKIKKISLSLRKKKNEESAQAALGGGRIFDKPAMGSEESSREGALMIDETISSGESDSNDFEEFLNKPKTSTNRRFNLNSKSQIEIVKKEKPESSERPDKNDVPSTSTETSSRNLQKNKDKEKKPDIASSSKRNRTEENDMFGFSNEGVAKRKKTLWNDDENDDLFVLFEDKNAPRDSDREDNIFEKEIAKIKKVQIKRRRSSLSSNDSSIEDDEPPRVKIERPDSGDEVDAAPLIRCKKEFNSSVRSGSRFEFIIFVTR